MNTVAREILYALRRLRGSPAFTIAATVTLAVAIGATASVFGVVDGVLLKAFPYPDMDRVLTLWSSSPEHHLTQSGMSPLDYIDFRAQNRSFIALAGSGSEVEYTVTRARDAERLTGLSVTPSYFEVLGIRTAIGRPLSPDSSGPPEVVISYGYWQRQFGGSPSVLGQTLTLDNPTDPSPTPRHTYTIVGVMPPGLPGQADVWTRLMFDPDNIPHRDSRWMIVYGRLKDGLTVAGANRELETIARRLAEAYPQTNGAWSVLTVPLLDHLVGPVRPALVMLLAAAACVLLIGAANLANLFLVRCLARQREMALRTALGATRGRLIYELLVEAGVLGVVAGALGVGVAILGVHALRSLAPPTLPRLGAVGVDGRVVAFCALVSLATVFVFGLLPAWRVSRGNLSDNLKQGGRGTGSAQDHRLQDGLVVIQVAVALVLLTGAGLLVESFVHFRTLDPGFRPNAVLTAQVAMPSERYPTADRQAAFLTSMLTQLAAQPGITAASASGRLPGRDERPVLPFAIVGDPAPELGHAPAALLISVSPGYFRTMGIAIRRGRGILSTDDARAVNVVVVDELLAKRFFGDRDPIGRRMVLPALGMDTMAIVGIVATVKENGLAAEDRPEFYVPYGQLFGRTIIAGTNVAIRTSGDPGKYASALKQAIAMVDPLAPVSHVTTMSERMVQSVGTTRFSSFLASLFAAIAFALGMVGIYSVLAYIVSQRHREIAVRLALGAGRSHVMGDVLRRALLLTGSGLVLGSGLAWVMTRALAGLFLGVSPHDPGIFIGAMVAFTLAALFAACVPAFRTTRISPVIALKSS